MSCQAVYKLKPKRLSAGAKLVKTGGKLASFSSSACHVGLQCCFLTVTPARFSTSLQPDFKPPSIHI
ncbi:hypothetical protein AMELA_G00090820 [Ameiurus melas]|uniref:Uncharacterized protein n=1 Tax=Ameiurus melas TaxID=219545 RepID=A0A7J6AWM1_AMEME|nr:hypothetical protein AMELA_G00090820 [Ameiurus melas]